MNFTVATGDKCRYCTDGLIKLSVTDDVQEQWGNKKRAFFYRFNRFSMANFNWADTRKRWLLVLLLMFIAPLQLKIILEPHRISLSTSIQNNAFFISNYEWKWIIAVFPYMYKSTKMLFHAFVWHLGFLARSFFWSKLLESCLWQQQHWCKTLLLFMNGKSAFWNQLRRL